MSFADEMADVVLELLGPGEETFGEDFLIERAAITGANYDPVTRRRTAATAPMSQVVRGTMDSELSPSSQAQAIAQRHERVLYAAPLEAGGFQPEQQDRVTGEGRVWQVKETAHVIKQGRPILWICGLDRS